MDIPTRGQVTMRLTKGQDDAVPYGEEPVVSETIFLLSYAFDFDELSMRITCKAGSCQVSLMYNNNNNDDDDDDHDD
ncbi:unnamed protein product [Porites lobata]|uniref:Uncharacterized protein n=1 Tax=Porites lobata TaxID=104759 RepID=A0ABN8MN68_9CNID|nr:unnamed protein product [Porites lobata]